MENINDDEESQRRKLLLQELLANVSNLLDKQTTEKKTSKVKEHAENSVVSSTTTEDTNTDTFDVSKLASLVPEYNPEDERMDIETWLSNIDRLGQEHNWNDHNKVFLIHLKLTGSAREWFRKCKKRRMCWRDWKVELLKRFKNRNDFAMLLTKMIKRRKTQEESYLEYYMEKLAMCERVKITGQDALSCIIDGLPDNIKEEVSSVQYSSPQEFLNNVLSKLDVSFFETEPKRKKRSVFERIKVPSRSKRLWRCFNCQKMGNHSSVDCPEPKRTCNYCANNGHCWWDCPERESDWDN